MLCTRIDPKRYTVPQWNGTRRCQIKQFGTDVVLELLASAWEACTYGCGCVCLFISWDRNQHGHYVKSAMWAVGFMFFAYINRYAGRVVYLVQDERERREFEARIRDKYAPRKRRTGKHARETEL